MDTKEYQKEYRKKNKDKLNEYNRQYRLKNKEKQKEYAKEYRENNKDTLNEYRKEQYKTPSGRKTQRIQTWKKRGIICDDWNETYEKFINCKNCELCNVEMVFGNSRFGRTLDHDHETGLIRNILCRVCNGKLPKQI